MLKTAFSPTNKEIKNIYIYVYVCDSKSVLAKHGDDSTSTLLSVPLSMTQPIRYLPTLCFLDPDNRSIAGRSYWSASK